MKLSIWPHFSEQSKAEGALDWCHICGKRSAQLADVFFPENAEHLRQSEPETPDEATGARRHPKYIRICEDCAEHISDAASSRVVKVQSVAEH